MTSRMVDVMGKWSESVLPFGWRDGGRKKTSAVLGGALQAWLGSWSIGYGRAVRWKQDM